MPAGRTTGSGGRGILCPQCVAQGYVWFWCCHSRLSWCVVTYYMSWMYMFRAAIVCVIVCHLFIHLPLCRVKCGELRLCLVLPLRVSMFVVCVNCFFIFACCRIASAYMCLALSLRHVSVMVYCLLLRSSLQHRSGPVNIRLPQSRQAGHHLPVFGNQPIKLGDVLYT